MPLRTSSTLLALALSATALVAPRPQELETPQPVDPDQVLIDNMEVVEDGLKGLRKQLSDPAEYPAALETLIAMQQAAKTCKVLAPPMTIGLPEPERPAFVLAYRMDMIALEEALLDLERAFLAGDPERVKERYKSLRDMEEPAHERFTEGG